MVLFRGTWPCDILLIGEAPGESEDVLGRPFVGAAGETLNSILAATLVQSVKVVKVSEEHDVRIDRTTKWGNPFKIGDPHPLTGKPMDRLTVINEYRKWFPLQKRLESSLSELCDQTLACHCAPLECHGDYLAERVRERFPAPTYGITNILGCIPWKEDGRGFRKPHKQEALACRERLLEIIRLCQPKAIVTMGKSAETYLPKVKDGLPEGLLQEHIVHPSALNYAQSDDPVWYEEESSRVVLTLYRLKRRLWGLS